EGIDAVRRRHTLSSAVVVFALAMTITTGCWIAGVPTLIQRSLHAGAGGFSIVMIGFAVGSMATGAWLARVRLPRQARASMLAWGGGLPAYVLRSVGGPVAGAFGAAVGTGVAESSSYVLLNSAAQEEIPDDVLGRVLGVISFVHRGSHATGLLLVAPLFAVAAARPLFAAAGVAVAVVGLGGALVAARLAQEAQLQDAGGGHGEPQGPGRRRGRRLRRGGGDPPPCRPPPP